MIRGLDGQFHPRLIALGGDHTIVSDLFLLDQSLADLPAMMTARLPQIPLCIWASRP